MDIELNEKKIHLRSCLMQNLEISYGYKNKVYKCRK